MSLIASVPAAGSGGAQGLRGRHSRGAHRREHAGDDPDVTHGAEVIVHVAPAADSSGIVFCAGEGIGTVTLPGLPLAVGEPAINPGPRAMIESTLHGLADEFRGSKDVTVTISIPGGEEMAAKTMNARLGIVGGLSVLGTTGVVIPYS